MRKRKNSAPVKPPHIRMRKGFGQIIYLGQGRARPYAVYPPAKRFDHNGRRIREKAICYVKSWEVGFAVLTSYNLGKYKPGDELELEKKMFGNELDASGMSAASSLIMAVMEDYTAFVSSRKKSGKTFAEVYDEYMIKKYDTVKGQKLSRTTRRNDTAGFDLCKKIHDYSISELNVNELQSIINACQIDNQKRQVKQVISGVFKFAIHGLGMNIQDPSSMLDSSGTHEVRHGTVFTDEELATLWDLRDDPTAEFILIMCFTGFRISAYTCMDEVNMEEWYLRGGVKTESSKGRIVPIHPMIQELVKKRMERDGSLLKYEPTSFNKKMKRFLQKHADVFDTGHHPHDCRHTFGTLCDRFEVKPECTKQMLGHRFQDITNRIYIHRELEVLREQIKKIDAVAILLRHNVKK